MWTVSPSQRWQLVAAMSIASFQCACAAYWTLTSVTLTNMFVRKLRRISQAAAAAAAMSARFDYCSAGVEPDDCNVLCQSVSRDLSPEAGASSTGGNTIGATVLIAARPGRPSGPGMRRAWYKRRAAR